MSFYKYFSEHDRVVGTNQLLETVEYDKGSGWISPSLTTEYNFTKYATGSLWALSNQVFDLTFGQNTGSIPTDANQKVQYNIYNQFCKTLFGYDENGQIKQIPLLQGVETTIEHSGTLPYCFFVNFPRSLVKDRIKENTFEMEVEIVYAPSNNSIILTDSGSETYTGLEGNHYGILHVSSSSTYTTNNTIASQNVGYVFYEAGVAMISPYIFSMSGSSTDLIGSFSNNICGITKEDDVDFAYVIKNFIDGGNPIQDFNYFFNRKIKNFSFKSVTELNSSIYFCRAFNHEFNYSSNPTYLSSSEIIVKGGDPEMPPRTYITTVGLYDDTNQLLAVAKLSEPVLKTPENELIARVRIDY